MNLLEDETKHQCLFDSGTTHTILKDKEYFFKIALFQANVNTISGTTNLIEGSGEACIMLPNGTKLIISNALYSSKSRRNLMSFKDIRQNGYHLETMTMNNKEYLCLTVERQGKKHLCEKLPAYSSGLYQTEIRPIEINMISDKGLDDKQLLALWHDRLGHPGTGMMHRIIENSNGHSIRNIKIPQSNELSCPACALGKLIIRPSKNKIATESPTFLERIQGDICGPIHPACGPFRYFMVLIDASTRWSHVTLLSSRNMAFAKLLSQIIRLRTQFPDYTIKRIRLDNAGEFTSQTFDDYCTSIGIIVEHPVPHVHTQNGLAESLIKRLQWIARPLLMRSKLPSSAWGHAIVHAASLIRLRPSAYHKYSPLQLVSGREPNISHLRVFGCAVYVPIAPPQRTKMGPQRRMGIYVGFESPSIIKYLEPMTGDLFTARFADCHFNETIFSSLGGEKVDPNKRDLQITWNALHLSKFDPRANSCEQEVKKIVHLQDIANRLPDAFTDIKKVTKSHIPAENAPARIEIPEEEKGNENESIARKKRGRPFGSKDSKPRKSKRHDEKESETDNIIPTERQEYGAESKDDDFPKMSDDKNVGNNETSINFVSSKEEWNRNNVVINDIFAYSIAADLTYDEDDVEPKTIEECRRRKDWPKWKEAIEAELKSLEKREVFGKITHTPKGVKPVGYKWVFVRKRNEKNEIVRYKARLVAQGFSQMPGVDYDETYSPVVDATTLRFLVGLTITNGLQMRLMDVVTAYLYGSLDTDIYMKIPDGVKLPENHGPREMFSVKLKRSLYGLKQSGRMWYNRLSEYLVNQGCKNAVPACSSRDQNLDLL